jgi:hypothetical protein
MNLLTADRRAHDSVSVRIYRLLLRSYPKTFRAEYGPHMIQVFRDSYRTELRTREASAVARLWLRTLLDLAGSAFREHLETERPIMKNFRRDLIAVIGCMAIIALAFFLLSYGRRHDVSGILTVGRFLDALVAAGVLGNLIVFLLVKISRLNPLRIALWTMLTLNGLLLVLAELIGRQVDPHFSPSGVVIAYAFSFFFWFALHWIWARSFHQPALGES